MTNPMPARVSSNPALFSPCHPKNATLDECLQMMTLDQKIGQMTQVANIYLKNPSDIATLGLGKFAAASLDASKM